MMYTALKSATKAVRFFSLLLLACLLAPGCVQNNEQNGSGGVQVNTMQNGRSFSRTYKKAPVDTLSASPSNGQKK